MLRTVWAVGGFPKAMLASLKWSKDMDAPPSANASHLSCGLCAMAAVAQIAKSTVAIASLVARRARDFTALLATRKRTGWRQASAKGALPKDSQNG